MIRKLINFTVILCLFCGLVTEPQDILAEESQQSRNGVHLVESNSDRVVVNVSISEYSIATKRESNITYHSVLVPGIDSTGEPGKPQLPTASFMLGVPANAEINLSATLLAPAKIISGNYTLQPGPSQTPLSSGEVTVGELSYHIDESTYSQPVLYPSQIASIAEDGYLRDQRVIRVQVSPFQYLPPEGKLILNPSIQITVQFVIARDDRQASEALDLSPQDIDDTYDRVLSKSLLNYDQAKIWRAFPEMGNTLATNANSERYKVIVDKDGIYCLSYSELQASGMLVDVVDPRQLHMTNQGRDVAIYVAGEEDGSFDTTDYLIFYGEKFRGDYLASLHSDEAKNWLTYTQQHADGTIGAWHPQFSAVMFEKYTNDNVYWLFLDDSGDPPRMQNVDSTPDGAEIPQAYTERVHVEREWRRWEYHFTSEDTWFGDVVEDTNVHTYTTTLSALAVDPFTATVRAEIVGFTYNDYFSPDHHTRFTLNGQTTPLDDTYWEGRSLYTFEKPVISSDLVEGQNQLNFQVLSDTVAPPLIYFNWFEIDYQRRFVAEADVIRFPGETLGVWNYQTTGFTSPDLEGLIITDPLIPRRLVNFTTRLDGDLFRMSFQLSHDIGAQFILASAPAFLQPKRIEFYIPPNLKSTENQADYLIITYPDFLAAAQVLADYRSGQGLRSMVINIDDVYNEFNEGIYHPIAIKNFLRYTLSSWQAPAPLYVVLVGDGTYNHKFVNPERYGYLPIYMPVNFGWVDPWQGEVDTTNLLATLVGDDMLPDIFIGRMPVNTPQELSSIIAKTMAFEQSPLSEWQRRNLFVADNTPDQVGDFVAFSERMISEYIEPGFLADRVYLDTFTDTGTCETQPDSVTSCPAANRAITETLSTTGAQLVTYSGHGSIGRWAHEEMLLVQLSDPYYSDIDMMQNGDKLPIILDMTCLDGYWFHPWLQPSLAETFIRTEGRGAVATFSPTGLGVATGHDALEEGILDAVYRAGIWELGPATLMGKLSVANTGVFDDLINTYMIFGDPALRMLSPYGLELSADVVSQETVAGSDVSYILQLKNTSALTDTFEIASSGNIWPTTLSSAAVSLAPGELVMITATVHVPAEVLGGEADSIQIEARSLGDLSQSDQITLFTTASVYGVSVSPASASAIGLPGAQVSYRLDVTNTSDHEDGFTATIGGVLWNTSISPDVTDAILPGGSFPLTVTVDIPPDATDYDWDAATITVSSQADPTRQALATLTTTARTYGVVLAPESQMGTGTSGTQVVYSVTLTNSGGFSDSYHMLVDSTSDWIVVPISFDLGPVMPGDFKSVAITVNIPDDAPDGYVDLIGVSSTSLSDPSVIDTAVIFTQVDQVYQSFLPTAYKY